MKLHALALLSMIATSGKLAQDFDPQELLRNEAIANYKGYGEFKMGKYESARQIWELLATRGNADALFNLAILAEDGLGEPKNMKKAEALYTAAANAGGFKAQYRLGMLYSAGVLLSKDPDKARRYLSMAGAGGDKDALEKLASLGTSDENLTAFQQAERLASSGRHREAAGRYAELAEQGNVTARTRLAWMYEAGRGVERSIEEAARLFSASAEANDPEAQYALAVMYKTGKGKPQSHSESATWMQRAAAQNYSAAVAAVKGEQSAR
jgi:TPR repeat protein